MSDAVQKKIQRLIRKLGRFIQAEADAELARTDESAKWYGLIVTVSSDGTITSELNNDPKCILEPSFIRT